MVLAPLLFASIFLQLAFAAPPPPPLEKELAALLNASCARAASRAPVFPPADEANFMKAYAQFNGTGSEEEVTLLAKQLLSAPLVQAFLTLPDSFVPAGGWDADMVLCAVLTDGTPLGLAEFAATGQFEENLIFLLLNDTILMRNMLLAGGPVDNQYGPAMAIYAAINASSKELARREPPSGAPWDDRNQVH